MQSFRPFAIHVTALVSMSLAHLYNTHCVVSSQAFLFFLLTSKFVRLLWEEDAVRARLCHSDTSVKFCQPMCYESPIVHVHLCN